MRPSAPTTGPGERARPRHDGGFTLIELLMAMSVFSILIVGFSLLFASSLKSFSSSRAQTAASQLAGTELEKARNVGWDNLGTVAGNPPGTLIAGPETVTVGSMTFTVTRRVELIDDPIPQGFTTGANYKRVIIKVTSLVMKTPLQTETIVAPPVQPSLYTAVMKITVVNTVDASGVLPNAVVSMTGGPSANRSDTTDSQGRVVFAGLTPHSNNTDVYTYTPTLAGWKPDLSVVTDGKVNLAPGDVIDRTLKMYKPGTITVSLIDLGNTPVTTPITLSVTGPDETGATQTDTRSFTAASGTIVLSDFKGGSIIPGQTYTFNASSVGYALSPALSVKLAPGNYPTNVDTPITIQLPIPARVDTTLAFVDQSTGLPLVVSGALVGTPTAGLDDPGAFTTNAAGVATFRLLPRTAPNKYLLTVTMPGYYPLSSAMTVDGSTKPIALTVALQPLPPPTPVTVTITGGSPVVPIAGATVTLSGGPSGTVTFVTDATGTGTANVVPGAYTVAVNQPGYVAYSAPLTVTTTTPPAVVVLGAKGTVTFRAKNGTTGTAIGPVTLQLLGGSGTVTVSIDSAGNGSAVLDPGPYTVTSTSQPVPYPPYSGSLAVVAGPQTADIAFVLGAVTFTTKDSGTNLPLANVTLLLKDGAGTTTTVTTNATGTSTPTTLVPGSYTYTTSTSGYASNKGSLIVGAGASTVNVNVTKGVTVTITTRAGSGLTTKVQPVTLQLTSGPGADVALTTAGSNADYTTMMLPGTYTVVGVSFPGGYTKVHSSSTSLVVPTTNNQTVTVRVQ